MDYNKLKEEIKAISGIASEVPEPFKERCFEVLLENLLAVERPAGRGQTSGDTSQPPGGDMEDKGGELSGTPSIREFLDIHKPKRNPDKIATIGCYLKMHEKKGEFTQEDLKRSFQSAAEGVPKSLKRDVRWAQKASWIAERPGKNGVFYVTNVGSGAVENKFPPEVLKSTSYNRFFAHKKRAKTAKKRQSQKTTAE